MSLTWDILMESLALKEIWVRWENLDYKENIRQTFHLKSWSAGAQKESCEAFAALEVYALNNQLLFFLYFFQWLGWHREIWEKYGLCKWIQVKSKL